MDYLAFFGLDSEPFSNAPVGRFYYDSIQHSQALVRLKFALSAMKGLAVCVGDVGSGKTTLARRLINSLNEDEYEATLLVILHRDITSEWLLRRIAYQLGIDNPHSDKLILLAQLYQRLVDIYDSGRKAVVLIDEAQMLETRYLMEEFRGLLNLEVPDRKLISFVFFGLPSMEENLQLDPPLLQRTAIRVKLAPLELQSTQAYINHRLSVAGASREIFEPSAIEAIQQATEGVPRLINTICDNALLECAIEQCSWVTADRVHDICKGLGLVTKESQPPLSPLLAGPTTVAHIAEPSPAPWPYPPPTRSPLDEIDQILNNLNIKSLN